MNRLQKKCLIASGLLHGLLCIALFVGSAFSTGKKQEETPVINVQDIQIVTDGQTTGGSPDAGAAPEPKKQTPVAEQKPQPPAPTPEPPKEVAKVKEPESEPEPELPKETTENVEPDTNPDFAIKKKPENKIKLTPVETSKTKTTTKPQTPKIVLKPTVRKPSNTTATAKNVNTSTAAADSQNKVWRELAGDISKSRGTIGSDTSSVKIGSRGPGGGGPVSANYRQLVAEIYHEAWADPQDVADESAVVKTEIIIERSGHVISARILEKSGIPALDKSVQKTLDRVRFIRPFPEASTDRQRTYPLEFNLKTKRLTG